ncbi:MAG: HAMP domain-containing histidine kinase [Bacteroidetes bacterium]|nr:HAMP domain-containing histidine kinase [Bacteroidota bacterium]
MQVYWLRQAFDLEEKKFSQNIQVSLLEVANEIDTYYGYQAPLINPVKKVSEDYYVVNIHNDFEAKLLELYLINIFEKRGINSDFEYAIYDCESDKMVYGSYVNMNKADKQKPSAYFPKVKNLIYYFAVRFPNKVTFVFTSLKLWIILSLIMVIALVIYLYAIYVILQQKRYAELQRDFINNMTHEFKTPLTSILIASNYLSKHEQLAADPKLEKYAKIVIEQSQKLNNHVEHILSLAKSDITPITLNKTTFNVIDVISNVIDTVKIKHEDAKISLEPATGDIKITADEFHFANIIFNFLDNSVKYCDQQPHIQIKVSGNDGRVSIEITDNGVGIPPKHLKHVFEKFYRVPGSKSAEVNGFGLGLYYVQKICKMHQWKLSVQNNKTAGITVKLTT